MTTDMSVYGRNATLNMVLKGSDITANLASDPHKWVALFTGDPGVNGGSNECTYTGYARVGFSGSANWAAASSGAIDSQANCVFPTATGGSETATHWGVFDASSSGNAIWLGPLESSILINNGKTPRIPSGSFDLNLDSTPFPVVVRNSILNNIFRGVLMNATPFPSTFLKMSLHTGDPGADGTANESAYTSYAKADVINAPFSTIGGGVFENTIDITFPQATGGSETATHFALWANGSTTQASVTGALSSSVSIASGDTPKVLVGNLTVTLTSA